MTDQLRALNIESRGNKPALKARLNAVKKHGIPQQKTENGSDKSLEYLLICDIEATCEDKAETRPSTSSSTQSNESTTINEGHHEIIEFPVLLYSLKEKRVIDEYRVYIKPVDRPILSKFCRSLTGIAQSTVDNAPIFPDALAALQLWLATTTGPLFTPNLMDDANQNSHGGRRGYTNSRNPSKDSRQFKGPRYRRRNWAWCTDGRADLEVFVFKQLSISKFSHVPTYFLGPYVDSRALFGWYAKGSSRRLVDQLSFFRLQFEGSEHSGLDDARNIARIVTCMIDAGWTIECNRFLEEIDRGWTGKWSHKYRDKREQSLKSKPIRSIDELD